MALILAHGLPKSGSTFLYQVALDAVALRNGFGHYNAKARLFGDSEIPDYILQPTDDILDPLVEKLEHGWNFVVKTHGTITDSIKAHIAAGRIKTFTSFRDPRDTITSMLDAGESDRRKGADRFFAKLKKPDDAFGAARNGWKQTKDWLGVSGILKIPYYLTATDQNYAIKLVCTHLGLSSLASMLQVKYAVHRERKITEFYKGVPDRFLDALDADVIAKLTQMFQQQIDETDALTVQSMNAHGFRLACQALRMRRDARLHAMGL